MLKGQDILVLLKLLNDSGEWRVRPIGDGLDLDVATVHRSLVRLHDARLIDRNGQRVNRLAAEEFLIHAMKYVFPVREGGMTRGFPTAWAAPPLVDELAPVNEPPPVWPDDIGSARGIAVEPIHANAPKAAEGDPALGRQLALLDAIRLGDGRIRPLAIERLIESLDVGVAA